MSWRLLPLLVAGLLAGNTPLAGENASNPLAAVNNTDVRVQYFDLDGPELYDWLVVDGAYMVTPNLKLKYEVHYWDTDVTGSSESDWESVHIKPIYFPRSLVGQWGEWRYKTAVGTELILDLGDEDKGIGSGSDVFAPLVGISMARDNTVLVPLVQHFMDIDGNEVSLTALRLIGLQSFPNRVWGKIDAKIPVDWEDDEAIPATLEAQLGKFFTPGFAAYVDALIGVGDDKPYEWGVGVGVRFKY
jgi:hypothetical protein